MDTLKDRRNSERGGAGVKLLIVIVLLALAIHAGLNFIPVKYNAASLKSDMETAVLQGLATPGKIDPVDNVKSRVMTAIKANNIPPTAVVDIKKAGSGVNARVAYAEKVPILPFGLYTYNFVFDETVTPSGFLLKQGQDEAKASK